VSGEERKVIESEKEGQHEGRGREKVARGRIGVGDGKQELGIGGYGTGGEKAGEMGGEWKWRLIVDQGKGK